MSAKTVSPIDGERIATNPLRPRVLAEQKALLDRLDERRRGVLKRRPSERRSVKCRTVTSTSAGEAANGSTDVYGCMYKVHTGCA